MKINEENLEKLETVYDGYLEGERIDRFFAEFEIHFAAGHWCAGDFLDRFATTGYNPELNSNIVAQIQ